MRVQKKMAGFMKTDLQNVNGDLSMELVANQAVSPG